MSVTVTKNNLIQSLYIDSLLHIQDGNETTDSNLGFGDIHSAVILTQEPTENRQCNQRLYSSEWHCNPLVGENKTPSSACSKLTNPDIVLMWFDEKFQNPSEPLSPVMSRNVDVKGSDTTLFTGRQQYSLAIITIIAVFINMRDRCK
ncbi:uncharacterized protein ARMOST_04574 [Armillaria ostoyae]|uniref:Uncharacterized protein n=1 Tax=Armillaria ostoyae TaxID=47428 RepID=A0A284QXQ3_ARMOS|nr:uncharacterized protein ARMOST_04574 [Armillaria ostoyae]